MCDYKVLHHTPLGYVVKCNKCHCIKVAFGSTVITLTETQFTEFKDTIEEYYVAHRNCSCRNHKKIEIPTGALSVKLLYSVADLEELAGMLDEAELSLEVQKLVTE